MFSNNVTLGYLGGLWGYLYLELPLNMRGVSEGQGGG